MIGLLFSLDLLRAAGYRPDAEEAVARVAEVYAAIDDATEDPGLRLELRAVCLRESWCNLYRVVGAHEVDAHAHVGLARWAGAVDADLLRPAECPEHALGDDPARWSTWGAFGQTATAVGLVDGCLAPEAMASPAVAATVAILTWESICSKRDLCRCEDRVAWWVGIGHWGSMVPMARLRKIEQVCGRRPPLARWAAAAASAVAPWRWPVGAIFAL